MNSFAIVVPCLNEVAYLDRLISSVLGQNLSGINLELILVDGNSTDGSQDKIHTWIAKDSRVKLLINLARITPISLNMGIEYATSDVVAILGAHAEVHVDYARNNLAALSAHPNAACSGGFAEHVDENETSRYVSLAMSSPFGVGNARFRTGGAAGYVDTVGCGAYRKEIFDKIGLFNTRLVRNQDDELNYRLNKAGYRIWFDPAIGTKYYVRASYGKLARQYRQYGYWKVFVNRLHNTVTTPRQVVPFAFTAVLIVLALGSLFSFYARVALCFCIGSWLVGAFIAAFLKSKSPPDWFPLIFTFGVLHLSYGWGYGQGIWDFLVKNKQPDTVNPHLTR